MCWTSTERHMRQEPCILGYRKPSLRVLAVTLPPVANGTRGATLWQSQRAKSRAPRAKRQQRPVRAANSNAKQNRLPATADSPYPIHSPAGSRQSFLPAGLAGVRTVFCEAPFAWFLPGFAGLSFGLVAACFFCISAPMARNTAFASGSPFWAAT